MTYVDRAMEIIGNFLEWTPEIGPCPIDINNQVWFTRLCALGETQAKLEARLVKSEFEHNYYFDMASDWKQRYIQIESQLVALEKERDLLMGYQPYCVKCSAPVVWCKCKVLANDQEAKK